MNFTRVYALILRQFYLVRATPTRFVQIFVWGTVDMILWGFVSKYFSNLAGTLTIVPLVLGAMLLWDYLIRVMQGVTTSFFEDVWSRNFLNIFSSPITVAEYLMGLVLTGAVTSFMALGVMVAIATLVFGLGIGVYGISLAFFVLILFLFAIALGILGASIVLRFGPSAEWFIWPIPAIISPFVGVLYPVSTLPHWMQIISRLLPPSYVFEGLRDIVGGGSFPTLKLILGISSAFIYIFLAALFFKSVHRKALKTGLIARYSAETIT